MGRTILFHHEGYLRYDFGGAHPLQEMRIRLAHELLRDLGLLDGVSAEEVEPIPADETAIRSVHTAAYVDVVKRLSENPGRVAPGHGFGPGDNPPFQGMYEASALQAGGTLEACEAVRSGRAVRAFNTGGGFHHAMPDRASGFCILNDVAVGIVRLLTAGTRRILYVDVDAHHADGVQHVFYRDPRVLTVSLHEDGRFLFPGTGFVDEVGEGDGRGYAVNVPLPPGTSDVDYVHAFDAIVPPLAEAFRPEVLFTQCGADAYVSDPLTHLRLTTGAYEAIAERFDVLSRRLCGGRWIAVTGGGYDPTACPRIWTLIFAGMTGRAAEDILPRGWLARCERTAGAVPKGGRLRDTPPRVKAPPTGAAERVVREVRSAVFPFHGLRS